MRTTKTVAVVTTVTYVSEVVPEVSTTSKEEAVAIRWADANPVVWKVVSTARSKAFGRTSCFYIGYLQRGTDLQSVLGRVVYLYQERQRHRKSPWPYSRLFRWQLRFVLAHYKERGFKGGFFQTHDGHYRRACKSMDYTRETLDEVIDEFLEWADDGRIKTVRVDGVVVRTVRD